VLSYRDHIDIGFLADADLVPDIWEVAAQVQPAFDELRQLAGEKDPTIVKPAAPVTPTAAAAAARNGAPKKKKSTKKASPKAKKTADLVVDITSATTSPPN
jgi:hypothetical protein